MKMKHFIWIGLAGLLAAALLAVLTARPADTAQATVVATATLPAPSPPADREIRAEGTLVPQKFARLSFETGGSVAEILVQEGQVVPAGALLVRLDTADLDLALDQANAQLAAAQAGQAAAEAQLALGEAAVQSAESQVTVAKAQLELVAAAPAANEVAAAEGRLAAAENAVVQAIGSRDATLEQIGTETQIETAQAELAARLADLNQIQKAYDDILSACIETPDGDKVCPLYGPVEETTRAQLQATEAAVDAAQAALNRLVAGPTSAEQRAANSAVLVARANRDLAQAQLDLLMAGARPQEIERAGIDVDQAQTNVELGRAQVDKARAALAQAEAGVQAAQTGVDAVELALERMTLTSPFAGLVTTMAVNPGELVSPGRQAVVLADVDQWLVETTDLTELDVTRIQEGDVAQIELDALPDVTLEGTIEKIALVASQSQGDTVYQVTIHLEPAAEYPLRWGMTAQVLVLP